MMIWMSIVTNNIIPPIISRIFLNVPLISSAYLQKTRSALWWFRETRDNGAEKGYYVNKQTWVQNTLFGGRIRSWKDKEVCQDVQHRHEPSCNVKRTTVGSKWKALRWRQSLRMTVTNSNLGTLSSPFDRVSADLVWGGRSPSTQRPYSCGA